MEKKKDCGLAIASIPIQTWGETYDLDEALSIGTVFKELNMPFFAADSMYEASEKKTSVLDALSSEADKKHKMLQDIDKASFAVYDLGLYLDTHADEKEAMELYLEQEKKRKDLMTEFAKEFYPLTKECVADADNGKHFSWSLGPAPWEGACE